MIKTSRINPSFDFRSFLLGANLAGLSSGIVNSDPILIGIGIFGVFMAGLLVVFR